MTPLRAAMKSNLDLTNAITRLAGAIEVANQAEQVRAGKEMGREMLYRVSPQHTVEAICASLPDPSQTRAALVTLLREELAQLHEMHRRTKKSEATLQKTVGRLTARIAQLEARGLTRSRWKADAPIRCGSLIYVQIDGHPRELHVERINWKLLAEPQWTLHCAGEPIPQISDAES